MRTVTFADLDVVDYLRQHFVLVWHDQTGGMPAPPEQAGAAPTGDYPEGGGGGNLRTFFCAPDGTVFRYLEGYWGPERYRAAAREARQLARGLTTLPEARPSAPAHAAHDDRRLAAILQPPQPDAKGPPSVRVWPNNGAALLGRPVGPILVELRRQTNRWAVFS